MRLGRKDKADSQRGDREREGENQGTARTHSYGDGCPEPHGTVNVTKLAEAAARKALPVHSGFLKYFPLVPAEVAKVSRIGNDQHNPGQPLHWSRGKSDDHLDSAFRHILDDAAGEEIDTDGAFHLAKAIWRLCAELQIRLEKRDAEAPFSLDVVFVDDPVRG